MKNEIFDEMNFKSEYKELQENIAPRAEFLERLEREMEAQKEKREKKERGKKHALVLAPILTTICASAAALTILLILPNTSRRAEPAPVNAANVKFAYATGIFGNEGSLSEGGALPRELAEMLSQSDTALYKSGTNTFDYDDKVDDGKRAALAKKIKAARETDSEAAENGDYYMITLENGDVFKFRISGDILIFENNFYKLP